MNATVLKFTREREIVIKPCPAHELNETAERYKMSPMNMGIVDVCYQEQR